MALCITAWRIGLGCANDIPNAEEGLEHRPELFPTPSSLANRWCSLGNLFSVYESAQIAEGIWIGSATDPTQSRIRPKSVGQSSRYWLLAAFK
jgi:hypothetical protein